MGTDFIKTSPSSAAGLSAHEAVLSAPLLYQSIHSLFFFYLALPPAMGPASVIKSAALLLFLIGL